jgi:hypothetical protein
MCRVLRALAGAGIFRDGGFGLALAARPRSDATDTCPSLCHHDWRTLGLAVGWRPGAAHKSSACEQICSASLFDYYAGRLHAAHIGAERLKSVGRGQDAAVAPCRRFAALERWSMSVAARAGCSAAIFEPMPACEWHRFQSATRGGHGAPAAGGQRASWPVAGAGSALCPILIVLEPTDKCRSR